MKKLSAAEKQFMQQQGKIVFSVPEKDIPYTAVGSIVFFAVLTGVLWIFNKEDIAGNIFATIFFTAAAVYCVYAAVVETQGTWFVVDETGVLAQRPSGEYFLPWEDCKLVASGYFYRTWPFLICSTIAILPGEKCEKPYNYISRKAMKLIKNPNNVEIPYYWYYQENDGIEKTIALWEANRNKPREKST